MAKVAFLGLGAMGFPIAGHLQSRGGHELTVYNRSAATADRWLRAFRGRAASTPREAAAGQDFVFCCVGTDSDIRDVTLGDDGALAGMQRDAIFVDHTTASADVARELSKAFEAREVHFLDAPVSGGQIGAEQGQLTAMCGGDAKAFARVEPILSVYTRSAMLMGGAGAGQLAKMANQICIAGVVQSLAEGLHFADRAGLDVERLIKAISKGSAQSWQMDVRCRSYRDGMPDFALPGDFLMPKDLGICLAEARRNGAYLPVAMLVGQLCEDMRRTKASPDLLNRLRT